MGILTPASSPDFSSPKKQNSRDKIYEAYREATGLNSVPSDLQYYTMCGKMYANDVKPVPLVGCEYLHAVSAGIITPAQFLPHGLHQPPL